jgi:hypothetical protein
MMQPIRCNDIACIASLKPGKVFLLCGVADDDLVLKTEGKDLTSVRPLSNSVMKSVDPQARVKSLDAMELAEIRAFVDNYENYAETLHLEPASNKAVAQLAQLFKYSDLCNPAYWTKMDKLELRNLDSTLRIPNEDERDSALDEFAKALSRNNGLGKLGEIVAADFFIGNTDRFEPFGPVNPYLGQSVGQGYKYNIPLKCIRNVGNVFIALSPDGRLAPSGIDYLDPNSSFESFQPLAAVETKDKWPGRALLTKAQRMEYAEKIASDLASLLNPRGRRRMVPILGFHAASQIEAGMVSGAKKVFGKMSEKFNNKPMPDSVKERMLLYGEMF